MSKTEVATVEDSGAAAPAEPMTAAALDRKVAKGPGAKPGRAAAAPAPLRVRVTFEEPAEWLQEVEEAADQVDRGVIRYTLRYDPPGEGYGMRKVELVAGAVVGGEIVELVAKAGAVWGDNGEADQETKKRVDTWHAQLVDLCGRKGLALKGGRFGAV